MKKALIQNTIIEQILVGLIACTHILPLCVAFASVTGQGLFAVILSAVTCSLFSINNKDGVLIPDVRFIVPIFYLSASVSPTALFIAMPVAALVLLVLKKLKKEVSITSDADFMLLLGLSIAATILLTNTYFGIGAVGSTPKEMLKSFVSFGFHPNFAGLLTGTIALFITITYPFKFKKLSKKISTPLIALTIPLILNLFLNPQKELTGIDEATGLSSANVHLTGLSLTDIPKIIFCALVIAFLLRALNQKIDNSFCFSQMFSPFPLRREKIKGFGGLSAIVVILISVVTALVFSPLLSRLSLHAVGAMLIVSSWQSIPYRNAKSCFTKKQNIILTIVAFFVFIICNPLFAITIFISLTIEKIKGEVKK